MCYAGIWIIGSREERDQRMAAINGSERVGIAGFTYASKKLLASIFSEIIITVCPSRVTMYNS
jgi:hypothetical protein